MRSDGGAGAAVRCGCRFDEIGPRLLAVAGIPERYARCTLDNFNINPPERAQQDELFKAREQCCRYVEDFLTAEGSFRSSGLLFVGNPGVGKTHLAVAVLKQLIKQYQVRGRFEDFTELIHRIQATFEPGTVDSKNTILSRATEAELLVLDDLGAQKLSEWVTEILYLVINTRYNRQLPTIFTTNLRLEPPRTDMPLDRERSMPAEDPLSWRIPSRLVSRLYEMAILVRIAVSDFRRSNKVPV